MPKGINIKDHLVKGNLILLDLHSCKFIAKAQDDKNFQTQNSKILILNDESCNTRVDFVHRSDLKLLEAFSREQDCRIRPQSRQEKLVWSTVKAASGTQYGKGFTLNGSTYTKRKTQYFGKNHFKAADPGLNIKVINPHGNADLEEHPAGLKMQLGVSSMHRRMTSYTSHYHKRNRIKKFSAQGTRQIEAHPADRAITYKKILPAVKSIKPKFVKTVKNFLTAEFKKQEAKCM